MTKTRSQTGNITIKKEEEEDCKFPLTLVSASNTRNKNNLPAQQVKVEEDTDTKTLLQSTPKKHSKLSKGQGVSQDQINQLIDYVVNHGMNVAEAARKANIAQPTAHFYYTEYKSDPEKKIPSPRDQRAHSKRFLTQEQIENLIRYIVDDKTSIPKASAKAKMSDRSGRKYYKKYLRDPDHAIPVASSHQDKKNDFLGYVINDKMSLTAASKKAKISANTGRRYYHEYFKVQNPGIPTPRHITTPRHYTQGEIKKVISYIVDDKMTIVAASIKAKMCPVTAGNHYRKYLKSHNMEIPVSKRYTQDEVNEITG